MLSLWLYIRLTNTTVNRAFEDISGRLTPVVGLLRKVKVVTAFSKPFQWKYGDTLDFDADIPKMVKKEQISLASSPVPDGTNGQSVVENSV
jgi:hypothetical protein